MGMRSICDECEVSGRISYSNTANNVIWLGQLQHQVIESFTRKKTKRCLTIVSRASRILLFTNDHGCEIETNLHSASISTFSLCLT